MFIPDFIGKTSDARGVLPNTITRADCAYNISRASFLVLALCMGNLDNLKWGVQDRIHQPQPEPQLVTMDDLIGMFGADPLVEDIDESTLEEHYSDESIAASNATARPAVIW